MPLDASLEDRGVVDAVIDAVASRHIFNQRHHGLAGHSWRATLTTS
jgi:hypothetical protein